MKPKAIGAFRARLRHLRNVGVPQLPNPGSGSPISYTHRQTLELLIALELERQGFSPKHVALLAPSIVHLSPYGQHEKADFFVALDQGKPGYSAFGLEAFHEFLEKAPNAFLAINVSALVRELNAALDRIDVIR